MIEFKGWPKIARLYRSCTITEKIDGTNAAIGIQEFQFGFHVGGIDELGTNHDIPGNAVLVLGPNNNDFDHGGDGLPDNEYLVYAQSRKRVITPDADNHGFARWVWDNAETLVDVLGKGLHFGEWWGGGINRGYGLPKGEHRLSLFNTAIWGNRFDDLNRVPGLGVVPILYSGMFSTRAVDTAKDDLRKFGSSANPGFMNPEGVVVYHAAANQMFKSTLENDEVPKEVAVRRGLRLVA